MPTVTVLRQDLFQQLETEYTDEAFDKLCFEFGIELDDVTSEKKMAKDMTGQVADNLSDEVLYKIEVPANRYDLLCLEGLGRALKIFIGKQQLPVYHLIRPKGALQRIVVHPATKQVRPIVVCGVLRNITFTPSSYKSFIDLQDKLHQNICRRRTLASVGTHDLDTIEGPFSYEALPPRDIVFQHLGGPEPMNAWDMLEFFEDPKRSHHLKPYVNIIKNSPVYPVIYDAKRRVLSLPPIINGEHSKIRLETKNVFIEVTATDLTKAHTVLNTIICMFSAHCAPQFQYEPVEVVEGEAVIETPNLSHRTQTAKIDYIQKLIGVPVTPAHCINTLNRMSLPAVLINNDTELEVTIPPTRTDVFHACDIMEDVAIGYGYNNLPRIAPRTPTVGKEQPLNALQDLIRHDLAMSGYTEILTFVLCSLDDNYANLRRQRDDRSILIAESKTAELQTCRVTLLSGALKTVAANMGHQLPIKIFEVGDVAMKDPTTDVGASNKRHVCALVCSTQPTFQQLHGLLDRMMLIMRIPPIKQSNVPGLGYFIQADDDPAFFPGRCAGVYVAKPGQPAKRIGTLGTIHPEVLDNYKIDYLCSALEFELTVDLPLTH